MLGGHLIGANGPCLGNKIDKWHWLLNGCFGCRDGHELLALSLENTFDVNSIVSNILQWVSSNENLYNTYETEKLKFGSVESVCMFLPFVIFWMYLFDRIVLIRDVPILQTQKERLEFEEQHVGKHDVIFSFQTAIGTHGIYFNGKFFPVFHFCN